MKRLIRPLENTAWSFQPEGRALLSMLRAGAGQLNIRLSMKYSGSAYSRPRIPGTDEDRQASHLFQMTEAAQGVVLLTEVVYTGRVLSGMSSIELEGSTAKVFVTLRGRERLRKEDKQ